ncbi:GNAT family acetyltransferase [Minwuia thermotolerans]|uniref:GNAT family acetyltransferase n=1 Tax=Minwuia thermotolerans TaxID=2056226 RepID=A0A2M9FXA7_9PROT|nr:GNAT family acetyltransferase [Minwuia thermotolerans]PJK28098.1 GNAT family acetyltransferase [Minwuia thermotolerans]
MEVALRPFAETDRAAVVALWHAVGLTRPWNDPSADIDRVLGQETATLLVAERAGALAGTVMCGFDGHRGWIYYLAVASDQRRRGLGGRLMTAAEDWLRVRGCPKAELMVRNGNDDAAAFYRALGYDRQPVTVHARWLIEPPAAPE